MENFVGSSVVFLITGILSVVLLRLAIIDLRTYRLPDIYTLPLIMMGLIVNLINEGDLPHDAIWGAIVGYAVFWVIGMAYFHKNSTEGLGLGDAKLMAAAGAWVGLQTLPYVLIIGAGSALVYALVTRHQKMVPISFGPWLSLGIWIMWIAKFF